MLILLKAGIRKLPDMVLVPWLIHAFLLLPDGRSVKKRENVDADPRANASPSNLITVIVLPEKAKSANTGKFFSGLSS